MKVQGAWSKFIAFVDVFAIGAMNNGLSTRLVILLAALPFIVVRQFWDPTPFWLDVFGLGLIASMVAAVAVWEWRRYVARQEYGQLDENNG